MENLFIIIPLLLISGSLGALLWKSRQQLRLLEKRLQQAELVRQGISDQLQEAIVLRDAMLKIVDDAVLVMNQKHQILHVNPAAEKLLGTNLVGKTLIRATQDHEMEAILDEAREATDEIPEQLVDLDGKMLRVRAFISETEPNEHTPLELMTMRDMTEMVRLGRARREMVANISHELRTPITSIGLLVDTLLNGAIEKPRRSKKMLVDIRREVDTLTQLVEEMRYLSRIESGQMPIKLLPTPLEEIIQGSIEPLQPIAERKNQHIIVESVPHVCVLADLTHSQRVLKNIVHNAHKFTREGGEIRVSAITNAEEVTIRVTDNGPGISSDDLPRIFERFYQASPSRSRGDGTGLGLAIARHIIIAHGGKIWAESKEGQGATFSFTLPLVEEAASSSTEAV
ncbi:MAG: PAS domain S-box protein [Chloroflexi bacterium]|nr:PAS domain S-box protein [Chloroflexota bacterium]NOG62119.1 PAS domain S-box protein [Chloroflexota bacterium]